ncbi:MAG: hypothetical protein ACUZ8E_18070 [Candidatus Anammoxibacter sp.]
MQAQRLKGIVHLGRVERRNKRNLLILRKGEIQRKLIYLCSIIIVLIIAGASLSGCTQYNVCDGDFCGSSTQEIKEMRKEEMIRVGLIQVSENNGK